MSQDQEFCQYWYEVVEDDSLRQGDIFIDIDCYGFADDLEPESDEAAVERFAHRDWIVAQASCDMQARGFAQILLLPVYPVTRDSLKIAENAAEKEFLRRLQVLRKGLHPRRFLLAPSAEGEAVDFPLSFVAWEYLAAMPTGYLRDHYCDGPRLRVMSPFREQFGNWVGARLSAVGPENHALIPPQSEHRIFDKHLLDAVANPDENGD